MPEDKDFQQRMQRVETLIRDIETTADPDTRSKAVELVQSLMEFHGAGVERMMEIVAESGTPGEAIFGDFARDPLVSSLLLLYGLHPVEFETRVVQALDKVRPFLASHKGGVELISMDEGVVRLRMQGGGGCPSTATTLKLAIEEAIYEAAPDVAAIEVEGAAVQQPAASGLVQLRRSNGSAAASASADGNGKGR
jgi:Fe-S cluster biogenesis protein NfuA